MNQTNPLDEKIEKMLNEHWDVDSQQHLFLEKPIKYLINAEIAKAEVKLLDRIYELSPKAVFGDWKPQDAIAFYDRLKVLEAELKARLPHG